MLVFSFHCFFISDWPNETKRQLNTQTLTNTDQIPVELNPTPQGTCPKRPDWESNLNQNQYRSPMGNRRMRSISCTVHTRHNGLQYSTRVWKGVQQWDRTLIFISLVYSELTLLSAYVSPFCASPFYSALTLWGLVGYDVSWGVRGE